MMAPRTPEELIFHMPTVERRAENDWARDFAASIRRQSRRRGWKPSEKQVSVMRRMVSELFAETADEDPILIEEDDT